LPFLNFQKILVTGGAGFIGSHLVDSLVSDGYQVVVLDDLTSGRLENLNKHLDKKSIIFLKGDIRDKEIVEKSLDGVEAIFHLAAITSVPYSIKHQKLTEEVNVNGTKNLLEVSLQKGVERFVFASSCAVYGRTEILPISEEHPKNPITPYAESKLNAEECCSYFQKTYGLKTTLLRIFNVYGSRMREDRYGGVIAKFLERIRKGKSPIVFGDGEQTRDFIYVMDVVKAMKLTLENQKSVNQNFNVGTGKPTTINRLAHLLLERLGLLEIKPIYKPLREGDIKYSYADIRKAKRLLSFKPDYSIKEGLQTLVDG
jgi:UDP-glucose 4-epimerase